VENFTLAQPPSNATPAGAETANIPGNPPAGAKTAAAAAKPPAAAPVQAQAPVASPAKVAKPSAPAGSYGIQLGAFKSSADAANRRWEHLDKAYPQLLAGLSPTVAPKKSATGTLYRLQVAGLTEKHARAICDSLKAKSQACVLILPAQH
jgi:cell division septation protein DedD